MFCKFRRGCGVNPDAKYDMRSTGVPVSTVVTALKQFFSELREPVIPLHLYDELKDAVSKFSATFSYPTSVNV